MTFTDSVDQGGMKKIIFILSKPGRCQKLPLSSTSTAKIFTAEKYWFESALLVQKMKFWVKFDI